MHAYVSCIWWLGIDHPAYVTFKIDVTHILIVPARLLRFENGSFLRWRSETRRLYKNHISQPLEQWIEGRKNPRPSTMTVKIPIGFVSMAGKIQSEPNPLFHHMYCITSWYNQLLHLGLVSNVHNARQMFEGNYLHFLWKPKPWEWRLEALSFHTQIYCSKNNQYAMFGKVEIA